MSDVFFYTGAFVWLLGFIVVMAYTISLVLNIILNKQLPFYKDLYEWIKYRRRFKNWLIDKGEVG